MTLAGTGGLDTGRHWQTLADTGRLDRSVETRTLCVLATNVAWSSCQRGVVKLPEALSVASSSCLALSVASLAYGCGEN